MKIGKGGSSVLGTPLNHIVLVLLGFFFGFLSAISFNQVLAHVTLGSSCLRGF